MITISFFDVCALSLKQLLLADMIFCFLSAELSCPTGSAALFAYIHSHAHGVFIFLSQLLDLKTNRLQQESVYTSSTKTLICQRHFADGLRNFRPATKATDSSSIIKTYGSPIVMSFAVIEKMAAICLRESLWMSHNIQIYLDIYNI